MPELPDVAARKAYLDATSLHQRIEAVPVADRRILSRVSPPRFRRAVTTRRFISSWRHGKNLLAELDTGPWVRFHFGMTGDLKYFGAATGTPAHTRLLLRFEGGFHLAFICVRMLGEVSLEESPAAFLERSGLGPDALDLTLEEFKKILRGRRRAIKALLMDQTAIAGLGNIYADEALFRARIHPRRKTDHLDETDVGNLYRAMRLVLRTAIRLRADAARFPRTWLIHRRREGEPCPRCRTPLERIPMLQRSTYLCPRCQPAP